MSNKLLKQLFLTLSLTLVGIMYSCQRDIPGDNDLQAVSSENVIELKTFEPSELEDLENILKEKGITVEQDSAYLQTRGVFVNDLFVSALKVSCKTPHPNGNGSYVDMSGVLLVPKKTIFTKFVNHRMIVAMPPTYTSNKEAPSNMFKSVSLISDEWSLNFFYFFTLQAKAGHVVLIPDYLGFGDSYEQCIHPYMEVKPMVSSVIDLIKAAKNQLSSNGYRHKDEVILTGYSQGGFMSASVARELELNPSHNIPVNLVVAGGTPCNQKQIADIVRQSNFLLHSFFLPKAIWGYKENGYPQINVNDVLQEPYASQMASAFDGTKSFIKVNTIFAHKVSRLYTEKFIKDLDTDPSLAYINDILNENSVKAWVNKCRFVMTHAVSDNSVYYENAKDFADQQNSIGGKVTFHPTEGEHILGAIPYYIKASSYFPLYR